MGCKHGAFISEDGDEWSSELPLLVTGHIHEYQRLSTNVLYPGTPIQHGFGESTRKTISLLRLSSHQPSLNKIEEERLSLGLVTKRTIRVNSSELEQLQLRQDDLPDLSNYRLVITGDSSEVKSLQHHPKISRWRDQGVKIVFRHKNQAQPIEPCKLQPLRLGYLETLQDRLRNEPRLLTLLKDNI